MQAFATEETVTRKTAIEQLSRIRFPSQSRQINECTLWRWCKLAGIQTGLSEFDLERCARLARIAQLKRQGYKEPTIANLIGPTTHDNDHPQSQTEPASTPFSGFGYTNPYQ